MAFKGYELLKVFGKAMILAEEKLEEDQNLSKDDLVEIVKGIIEDALLELAD